MCFAPVSKAELLLNRTACSAVLTVYTTQVFKDALLLPKSRLLASCFSHGVCRRQSTFCTAIFGSLLRLLQIIELIQPVLLEVDRRLIRLIRRKLVCKVPVLEIQQSVILTCFMHFPPMGKLCHCHVKPWRTGSIGPAAKHFGIHHDESQVLVYDLGVCGTRPACQAGSF